MKNNILLKSALALAIVDLVLIAAILLQVNNLVKDILELQNKQLEIGVMRERLEKAEETKAQETKIEEKEVPKLNISDWQEFSGRLANRKVGFSFKFPPIFVIYETFTGYALQLKPKSEKAAAIIIDGYESNILASGHPENTIRSYSLQNKQEKTLSFGNATVFKLSGKDKYNKNRAFAVWREKVGGNEYIIEFMTSGDYPDIDEIEILDKMLSAFKLIE